MENDIFRSLRSCGLRHPNNKILTKIWATRSCAYVIYDKNRQKALDHIFPFLEKNHIHSTGRYGGWKYSFMEEAILDGKEAAEKTICLLK